MKENQISLKVIRMNTLWILLICSCLNPNNFYLNPADVNVIWDQKPSCGVDCKIQIFDDKHDAIEAIELNLLGEERIFEYSGGKLTQRNIKVVNKKVEQRVISEVFDHVEIE